MEQTHPDFVITRTFDAPREIVWRAFTEAERLAQWWGPKGFEVRVSQFDFRPGGLFVYQMISGQGNEMWGRFAYREIDPQDRVVFVNSFSDESGGITRAPFSEDCPLEMLNTFTFEDVGDKTTLTVRSKAFNATPAEQTYFDNLHESMTAGFGGTFDKLDDYLQVGMA